MQERPLLPEDGFTTNTPTGGKITKYYLTHSALRRVRAAAKYAGLHWKSIAARPSTALEFCKRVEAEMD